MDEVDVDVDMIFIRACQDGDLVKVKECVSLSEEARDTIDIDYGFTWACSYGHLDVVRFLLTSEDLPRPANIYSFGFAGFKWACSRDKLNVVQFLLTSLELAERVDVHGDDDWIFKTNESNSTIQWVRDWHQANMENDKLNKLGIKDTSKSVKVNRL